MSTMISPDQLATERTREILQVAQHARHLIIDSPPGAGKTGVAERLAVHAAWISGQRVMIATQTNQQALDLARRIASTWRDFPVHLHVRRDLPLPQELQNLLYDPDENPAGPVHRPSSSKMLPRTDACVVISNSQKWAYTELDDNQQFDLMIVEEAYQLRDANFAKISGFARRHVLVGDPGQIAPVTSADTIRWEHQTIGPHTPAPTALLERRPAACHRMQLPVSRRLPHDTVELIAPVFYPTLPFEATSAPHDRQLLPGPATRNDTIDAAIDGLAGDQTIRLAELESKTTTEHDPELASTLAQTALRLLNRGTHVRDWTPNGVQEMPLTARQIGVVCAHRSQVTQITEQLRRHNTCHPVEQILVETADRFQGLERQVMLVHHPLSGRLTAQDFHVDVGRLCVMLSRHRISCLVFGRAGMRERLIDQPLNIDRPFVSRKSTVHDGTAKHLYLLELLDAQQRVTVVECDTHG